MEYVDTGKTREEYVTDLFTDELSDLYDNKYLLTISNEGSTILELGDFEETTKLDVETEVFLPQKNGKSVEVSLTR